MEDEWRKDGRRMNLGCKINDSINLDETVGEMITALVYQVRIIKDAKGKKEEYRNNIRLIDQSINKIRCIYGKPK